MCVYPTLASSEGIDNSLMGEGVCNESSSTKKKKNPLEYAFLKKKKKNFQLHGFSQEP